MDGRALMPPRPRPFVQPAQILQRWTTLEETKIGLKFVLDPDRPHDLYPQSEIQRVTDRAIELWYMPLHSCVEQRCAGTAPPLLVGIFHRLQQRCQILHLRAHVNRQTDGWVRRQVLLVLVSRNARKDAKPLSR